jgi:hypothetical protein
MTDNLLTEFAPISLSSYSSVGPMKRVDTKYIFNKKYLSSLIQLISQDYSVLTTESINSIFLIAFFDEFVLKLNRVTVVVLDNAKIHKSNTFKERCGYWQKKDFLLFTFPLIRHILILLKNYGMNLNSVG